MSKRKHQLQTEALTQQRAATTAACNAVGAVRKAKDVLCHSLDNGWMA
jgi:hypothetical protein